MRILFILLLISFNSFSQTYEDIMSINTEEMFVKVMIENNYIKDNSSSLYPFQEKFHEELKYKLIDGRNSARYIKINDGADSFFAFGSLKIIDGIEVKNTLYDRIFSEVKNKCEYKGIVLRAPAYKCEDASYSGVITFQIENNEGIILQMRRRYEDFLDY